MATEEFNNRSSMQEFHFLTVQLLFRIVVRATLQCAVCPGLNGALRIHDVYQAMIGVSD